jgi:MerR family transcriptional regulator, light-induced transcriptional regulator
MAKFNLENTPSAPSAQVRVVLPEALRQGTPVGPRLVGGTRFAGKAAMDVAQIQILAQACLQGLDAARQVVFGWQRQGQSLEDIYLHGITPCARLLGVWWGEDRLDFAMVTIASTHLQQLLHDFSDEFLEENVRAHNGCSVLLLTEPGAQHSMGLFMLSEFFKRAGWTVCTGVPPSVADFKRLCHSDWFDAVGVSVSTDRHLAEMASVLSRLPDSAPNPRVRPFVGGPMAFVAPDVLRTLGCEVLALDAAATVARIQSVVAEAGSWRATPAPH